MKKFLLSLPTLLGLLLMDQLGLLALNVFVSNGKHLTALEIILVALVEMLLIAYFLYWGKKQGFAQWSFKNAWTNKGKIILGFVAIVLFQGFYHFLLHTPITSNQQSIDNVQRLTPVLLMCLITGIGAPVLEETIFRLGVFKLALPDHKKISLVISTIFFAFMHMTHELTNPISWPPYLFMGIVFGYLYYKTDKVEVSASSHFLLNSFVTFIQLLR
jgi:membrane protease YdiL (CAAX protease family)